jgi:hypothetical protein
LTPSVRHPDNVKGAVGSTTFRFHALQTACRGARRAALASTNTEARRGRPEALDATESAWQRAYQRERAGQEGVLAALGE